jgi:SAM-dependent methyltransferase
MRSTAESSRRTSTLVREGVARAYTQASWSIDGARIAGYSAGDLTALPDGIAGEFLGCGNPLAFADVLSGQTVLDLGCGAGIDVILAAKRVGRKGRVIGVDMTETMVLRARRNAASAGLGNVEIRQGLVESLPVESSSVDWVISNCVISLSPEKERVFAEVARVLRPGGKMLISDIVVDDTLATILRRMTRVWPSIAGGRTETHYLRAMSKAGLADLEVRGRFVYEPEHLVGMFGPSVDCAAKRTRVASAFLAVKRQALALAARGAAGRVWSAKFAGRKPVLA